MLNRTKTSLALALAGCAVTTGVAVASSDGSPSALAFNDAPTARAQAVTTDQLAFPILRRSQSAADAVPASVAAQIGNPDVGGKNVKLARSFSTPSGPGWVVPGAGSICVAVPDPLTPASDPLYGVSCNSTAWAATHGLSVLLQDPTTGDGVIAVVAPDGATASVATASGAERPLALKEGVAVARVSQGSTVTVSGAAGVGTFPVPDPGPVTR